MTASPNEITIGNQTWMSHNFSGAHFRNGEPIPEIKTNEDWENAGADGHPAWCHYNNAPGNEKMYGALYNSFAITDKREMVPQGWRVPTAADWDELIEFLGGNKIAGKKLKSADLWMTKENGGNGNGSNESGFNAYASGQRDFLGQFSRMNLSCMWWCAPADGDNTTWFYYLDHDSDKIEKGIADPEDGFSVRLVKIR